MTKIPKISLDRVKELVTYDPETGPFHRRTSAGKARAGDVCGWQDPIGYWRVRLDGQVIWAHRLAWFYVHGAWPSKHIDHINRSRSDNRIQNLRDVSHAVNCRNRPAGGVVPLLGVVLSRTKKRFRAQITIDRRTRHIGSFKTAEEAHQAYLSAQPKILEQRK